MTLYLLAITLLFIHFQLVVIGTTPITLPWLMCPLLVIIYVKSHTINLLWVSIICFVMAYTVGIALVTQKLLGNELTNSLILIILALTYLFLSVSRQPDFFQKIYVHKRIFLYVFLLSSLYTIAQALELNVWGNGMFLEPFGSFTRLGPGGETYSPYQFAKIKKASGLLSEPSVAAWYHFAGAAIALSTWFRSRDGFDVAVASVSVLAMLLTMSLSGVLNIILLLIGYLCVKKISLKKIIIILLILFCIFIFSYYIGFIEHIKYRASLLLEPGNSLYYRIIAPLYLINNVLIDYPLGVTLGNETYIATKWFMVNAKGGSTTNIDNAFFLFIYRWGWGGVFVNFYILYLLSKHFLLTKYGKIIPLALFAILFETGSVWNPSTVFMMALLIQFHIAVKSTPSNIDFHHE